MKVLGKGSILLSNNVVGNASTEHSFSIWISKELSMKLAPSVRVLVWFITSSGEVITDSTELAVSDYFTNQVCASTNAISLFSNKVESLFIRSVRLLIRSVYI